MKHIFIVNPTSGGGKPAVLIPFIHEYFKDKKEPYEIFITERKGHATDLARRYSIKDDVTLYIVGGDGTIFEVLNGLNDSVPMAIIPAGTGNDAFRMLGVEPMNPKDILIQTIEGKYVKADYGLANDQRFINCSTMGMDADVGEFAERIGKRLPIPRTLVYIISAMFIVLRPKTIDLEIDLGDRKILQKSLLVAVMNGRWYGGGFQPAPMASIQDGKLDVCMVSNASLFRIFQLLPMYFKGTHVGVKEATFLQADSFTLSTGNRVVQVGFDGENSKQNKIVFKLMKLALTLKVPKSSTLREDL